ncbi:formimidoylglutamase [Corynebacterium uropygiale]|uniref:Formimidoylglutamase n=1 Tax=Corynebacterium uropygiale TaxID=1775911 RepID=A0A9X1TZR5_9CORY|nr:formimidoylglutamase [Corynebacterium uropygiale]MCF4005658.1 formimidoylglutamase [Corynebacterium uropygiale]
MHRAAESWTGRADGPRWHHIVRTEDQLGPGDRGSGVPVGIVGFASDEGVRRNHGRPGAAAGPSALREALGSLAILSDGPDAAVDYGDIVPGEELEHGHAELSALVSDSARRHPLTVVLGGGHETAYGSHCGLRAALPEGSRVGVLNIDAHYDLREAPVPTSGTPFLQICREFSCGADYTVLGISAPNNTQVLRDTAADLGAMVLEEDELSLLSPAQLEAFLHSRFGGLDALHLSVDLDVLPAAIAPGVSAPAAVGVELSTVRRIVRCAAASGVLRLMDVVELNPRYDVDGRTAKVGARLIADACAAYRAPR